MLSVRPIAEAAYRGLAPVWPRVYRQRPLEVTSESRKVGTKMPSRSRAAPKSSAETARCNGIRPPARQPACMKASPGVLVGTKAALQALQLRGKDAFRLSG